MKIKNIFKKWNDGKIDETKLFNQNQSLFDNIDNELKNIYFENMLFTSLDIILCDFVFINLLHYDIKFNILEWID